MKGSGWLAGAIAMLLFAAAVGYPIVAAGIELASAAQTSGGRGDTPIVALRSAWSLLAETSAYAAVVALGAMLCGWAPGRWLGRALTGRGFVPLAALLLFPICLPAYVVFYSWWQAWPADSVLHAWAIERDAISLFRRATLILGLICWSWPLAAWCVAGSVAMIPAQRDEMLRLDGARWRTRLADRLRTDGRGLAIGGLLAFLATFNNTTCFDLAGVFSFGNELRAKDAVGATPLEVLVAAMPAIVLGAAGAVIIWILLGAGPRQVAKRGGRAAKGTRFGASAIWLVSVLVPIVLLARNLARGGQVGLFFDFYGRSLTGTIELALISGGLAVLIALGLTMMWSDPRKWVRSLAHIQAMGWLIAALAPGTIVGVALEAAYNLPIGIAGVTLADVVYRNEIILIFGHLARFGFVAALLGRWVAAREPRNLLNMRRLDGAETLWGAIQAAGPRLIAAGVASLAIVFVLAMGEVAVTARIHPPGSDPLGVSLLNAMHYQRPQTVIVASLLLMVAAGAAALLTTLLWMPLRRIGRPAAMLMVIAGMSIALAGCGQPDPADTPPLKTKLVFGARGVSLGQFAYPRCMSVDAEGGVMYVIDKTARVQRFGLDGKPQTSWRMPAKENGKPTGVSVAPDGRVFVADTHYYRVIAYDRDGNELMRFGSYGEGPGQFIYTTDIAFGPEGRLYVAEYGGNDRVQVFSPGCEYLFEFGTFGSGVRQFNRPQSMMFNKAGTELHIADACNHRIVRVDPQGQLLGVFGTPGVGRGELQYPYGLKLQDDGTLLVSEFGNSRIQRFTPEGRSLGLFGRLGAGEGELRYPWAVDVAEDLIFVLDSGNNRVQAIRKP